LLELLNKVCDLGLLLLIEYSGGARKSLRWVWFRRGYSARGLGWFASVVLHDSWCPTSRITRVTNRPLAAFVWAELTPVFDAGFFSAQVQHHNPFI
jgi:hypothetical protein